MKTRAADGKEDYCTRHGRCFHFRTRAQGSTYDVYRCLQCHGAELDVVDDGWVFPYAAFNRHEAAGLVRTRNRFIGGDV